MIVLYILETCPYCRNALSLLDSYKIKYKKIIVENTEEAKNYYKKQSKMNTFPQIFIKADKDNYTKIGGYDDLSELINYCKNLKNDNLSLDIVNKMYKLMYKK
jgi:glutaredoxin 3